MIQVLEVDQWTATGNIREKDFKLAMTPDAISGGDSEAARAIFGGNIRALQIEDTDECPPIGRVWFTEGLDGKCQFWKANYDSSG